jgi:TRAP-type mannitol/chloroaromatic compound transport system permease small subunit
VESSVRFGERSREAGGLPALFLLKAIIPLMAVLLTVQGLAVALKCIAELRRPRES